MGRHTVRGILRRWILEVLVGMPSVVLTETGASHFAMNGLFYIPKGSGPCDQFQSQQYSDISE